MILELFYGEDCKSTNLLKTFGGMFDFEYTPAEKKIRITTQVATETYSCIKLDFSNQGHFAYASTGTEPPKKRS